MTLRYVLGGKGEPKGPVCTHKTPYRTVGTGWRLGNEVGFFLSAAAEKPWKCEAMCERPTETSIEHDKLKPLNNNTAVDNSTQTRRLY